ncbi:hypothetical protein A2394_01085 [Candidatus Woesebacteria bacterium RIFOXYB1_FULL_42_36]|uniref:Uncharacterized protein n=3 Tax=Candidatus Woeseibacteriota TaxID=1752722 RepID=A0A837IA24_9BACT|nr:MAG: hypothetical protein UW20_C0005G0034 [Candidatus Woesebacteria bacterium GW2011_GWB1_44_11]KKT54764.1 MAG: hypothetical protein UW47_C0003G0033 [Candidatus Woesebacteria bacterium GW2011_GWA1_44_23]OGM76328.1 MAG: hypothetical protein A2208_01105 [Candidatus Woesebacteria bacterium RIFOXYA1_FULL_43_16]OGM81539.1 MAG: hypothetical protein A2394_01085 [Candidatus Woesebacteria bacterium RIFOXYB1_FULL_42_36]OGM84095.1 MAG: hypothetical protein A2421_02655 [Candidatus Woesebacteria bacteriu
MLIAIVVILVILWFLGYMPLSGIPIPNVSLFTINGHPVTLWELLILIVVVWAIGILPAPLQTIAGILLILWILSVLGILAITGLPNVIVLVIIVGLILSVFL